MKEKLKQFFKPYPKVLPNLAFRAFKTYDRKLLKTVLDTTKAIILDEEEYYNFPSFRQKLLENYKDTKPAKLRGLSHKGIRVMESQNRQVTYKTLRRRFLALTISPVRF